MGNQTTIKAIMTTELLITLGAWLMRIYLGMYMSVKNPGDMHAPSIICVYNGEGSLKKRKEKKQRKETSN
jgi:hypothetical protein